MGQPKQCAFTWVLVAVSSVPIKNSISLWPPALMGNPFNHFFSALLRDLKRQLIGLNPEMHCFFVSCVKEVFDGDRLMN